MICDSLSLSENSPIASNPLSECKICLEKFAIERLSYYSSSTYSKYIYLHLSSHMTEVRIRIIYSLCPHIFTRQKILSLLCINDHDENTVKRYKRFYTGTNSKTPEIQNLPLK